MHSCKFLRWAKTLMVFGVFVYLSNSRNGKMVFNYRQNENKLLTFIRLSCQFDMNSRSREVINLY